MKSIYDPEGTEVQFDFQTVQAAERSSTPRPATDALERPTRRAELRSVSIARNRREPRARFGARQGRFDQSQHSRLIEPLGLVQGTPPHS